MNWQNNCAKGKNDGIAADKAAATSESEPGDFPSHSLRTTLAVRCKRAIGTGQGRVPGDSPKAGPGERLGSFKRLYGHKMIRWLAAKNKIDRENAFCSFT